MSAINPVSSVPFDRKNAKSELRGHCATRIFAQYSKANASARATTRAPGRTVARVCLAAWANAASFSYKPASPAALPGDSLEGPTHGVVETTANRTSPKRTAAAINASFRREAPNTLVAVRIENATAQPIPSATGTKSVVS